MSKTLRKFIRSIIKEDEDLLKKWGSDRLNDEEQDLVELGYTLIPHGKQSSSLLGFGEYQSAYEILWNGKRAVVKVTDSKVDVDNMTKLYELKSTVPSEIAKHIMSVYDVKTKKGVLNYDKSVKYFVVVEYLNVIPESLKRDLYGVSPYFDSNETNPYKKEELESITREDIETIIKSTLRGMSFENFPEDFFSSYEFDDFVESVHDGLSSIETTEYEGHKMYQYNTKTLLGLTDKMDEMLDNFDEIEVSSKSILMLIKDDINSLLSRHTFPEYSEDDEWRIKKAQRHPDSRVRSFINFLLYLKDKFNMNWDDVHQANIMIRPSTGDIVLSDPGLFV